MTDEAKCGKPFLDNWNGRWTCDLPTGHEGRCKNKIPSGIVFAVSPAPAAPQPGPEPCPVCGSNDCIERGAFGPCAFLLDKRAMQKRAETQPVGGRMQRYDFGLSQWDLDRDDNGRFVLYEQHAAVLHAWKQLAKEATTQRDRAKAELAAKGQQLAALENYTSTLLERLTDGRISKPTAELADVDSAVDEVFTSGLRAALAGERATHAAALAARDAEIARLGQQFAALENYTAVLLDRLTNGRISKPMTELVCVETEVDEAFTKEIREELAALQPLAAIGRLAVAIDEAEESDDYDTSDILQSEMSAAVMALRAAQPKQDEGDAK